MTNPYADLMKAIQACGEHKWKKLLKEKMSTAKIAIGVRIHTSRRSKGGSVHNPELIITDADGAVIAKFGLINCLDRSLDAQEVTEEEPGPFYGVTANRAGLHLIQGLQDVMADWKRSLRKQKKGEPPPCA